VIQESWRASRNGNAPVQWQRPRSVRLGGGGRRMGLAHRRLKLWQPVIREIARVHLARAARAIPPKRPSPEIPHPGKPRPTCRSSRTCGAAEAHFAPPVGMRHPVRTFLQCAVTAVSARHRSGGVTRRSPGTEKLGFKWSIPLELLSPHLCCCILSLRTCVDVCLCLRQAGVTEALPDLFKVCSSFICATRKGAP
jgi:hypothetical protein